MKFTVFIVLTLLLIGCQASELKTVEFAAKAHQECLINQVLPDDCDDSKRALLLADLRATQSGLSRDRISASRGIGANIVVGDPSNSPYQRVLRSLEGKPFYVDPERDNFLPYLNKCKHGLSVNLRGKDMVRAVGYIDRGAGITFFLLETKEPCRPDDYLQIDEQFPYLSEAQASRLASGEYWRNNQERNWPYSIQPRPADKEIRVERFGKMSDFRARFEELSGRNLGPEK
ncbi:hypothetical protein [Thioalkalivibrio thiocyanodenitrificans]|uniref:hypothetical protein n=1 Tax=Thioalkalivibrio thiocyanodenitrificans TaxID=243063 RepID=UPI0012E9F11B|nr:hypothetical protein [Thioalkalivibrio thiocyanodenitrificans]